MTTSRVKFLEREHVYRYFPDLPARSFLCHGGGFGTLPKIRKSSLRNPSGKNPSRVSSSCELWLREKEDLFAGGAVSDLGFVPRPSVDPTLGCDIDVTSVVGRGGPTRPFLSLVSEAPSGEEHVS